ncbi:MAG: hypothetical protein QOD06_318 [Candidatus Binatota bacterium]|jgi:hypothetical protein|nr:hypothetical protein [Candidatus Binatota bacterium]
MNQRTTAGRGPVLTTVAILMALLAISNFSKPFTQAADPGGSAGFVFFGHRLHGLANAIAGPLFGVLLAAYAWGVWHLRSWVLPLAIGYAAYVVVNLVLYFGRASAADSPGIVFGMIYALVAIGVSSGGAIYLFLHRDRLR